MYIKMCETAQIHAREIGEIQENDINKNLRSRTIVGRETYSTQDYS